MSFSAHKTYGPKGMGALFVRRKPRVRIEAQMHGGGHERGMRSGTLPTHQIVGMGEAFRLAKAEMAAENERIRDAARPAVEGPVARSTRSTSTATWSTACRTTSTSSFNFVEGESLIMAIKDIAVSSGSACTSASLEPSYVLRALGRSDELAHSSIRFTVGRFTTEADDRLHDRAPEAQGRASCASCPRCGKCTRKASTSTRSCGRRTSKRRQRSNTMAYSDKVLDHYENPRNVGSFAKDAEGVGTGMVGAPACGDVMKLQIRVGADGLHRGCQVQDLRLRLGDRVVVARHRMGEGQDARRGDGDPQHADRRGAGAAAGQDPLLDPGRGRDQGGGRRLPDEARRRRRGEARAMRPAGRGLSRRTSWNRNGDYTDRDARRSTSRPILPSAARASACASACARPGCSGLAYKLEYADDVRPEDLRFESHGVTVVVDPKSLPYLDGTRARLRARGIERRLQVQQPERQGRLRLRRVLQRLEAAARPALSCPRYSRTLRRSSRRTRVACSILAA